MRRDLGDFQTPPELVDRGAGHPGADRRRDGLACWSRPAAGATSSPGCWACLAAARDPGHRDPAGPLPSGRRASRTGIAIAPIERDDHLRGLLRPRPGSRPGLARGRPACWWSAIRPGSRTPSWGAWRAPHVPPEVERQGARAAWRPGPAPSNFDVAEAVWLKLARELAAEAPTIALLCKTSVARGILQFAHRAGCRSRPRRSVGSMPRDGSARRWTPACSRSRSRPGSEAAERSTAAAGIPVYPGLETGRTRRRHGFLHAAG